MIVVGLDVDMRLWAFNCGACPYPHLWWWPEQRLAVRAAEEHNERQHGGRLLVKLEDA